MSAPFYVVCQQVWITLTHKITLDTYIFSLYLLGRSGKIIQYVE